MKMKKSIKSQNLMSEWLCLSDYNDEKVIAYLNSELANNLGNLLSRCTAKSLNPRQLFPAMYSDIFHTMAAPEDVQMWRQLQTLPGE